MIHRSTTICIASRGLGTAHPRSFPAQKTISTNGRQQHRAYWLAFDPALPIRFCSDYKRRREAEAGYSAFVVCQTKTESELLRTRHRLKTFSRNMTPNGLLVYFLIQP